MHNGSITVERVPTQKAVKRSEDNYIQGKQTYIRLEKSWYRDF